MPTAPRVPGIPDQWQNFGLAIIFHMTLPLVPLVLEWITTSRVEDKSIILTAALYGITLGVASTNLLVFGIGVLIGIMFASVYGVAEVGVHAHASTVAMAKVSIGIVFVSQFLERYNRHVIDRHPYFEFMKPKKAARK